MLKLIAQERERIDKFISQNSEISRNDIKELILQGAVSVGDMVVRKPGFLLKEGHEVIVSKVLEKITTADPEQMDLNIVYEDDDLMIINKASGLVVHPAPGNMKGTLVNGLMGYSQSLSNENGLLRPGIVHRLDKNTSGLLVVAKNNEAHRKLAEMLAERKIKRQYYAIVHGYMQNQITHIDAPIGRDALHRKKMMITNINSKAAQTDVYLLEKFNHGNEPFSLVSCQLSTGRTHQIRVHLNYIQHPVYNDPVYSKGDADEYGQYLHAYKLEFDHPRTGEHLLFETSLPEQFKNFMKL